MGLHCGKIGKGVEQCSVERRRNLPQLHECTACSPESPSSSASDARLTVPDKKQTSRRHCRSATWSRHHCFTQLCAGHTSSNSGAPDDVISCQLYDVISDVIDRDDGVTSRQSVHEDDEKCRRSFNWVRSRVRRRFKGCRRPIDKAEESSAVNERISRRSVCLTVEDSSLTDKDTDHHQLVELVRQNMLANNVYVPTTTGYRRSRRRQECFYTRRWKHGSWSL